MSATPPQPDARPASAVGGDGRRQVSMPIEGMTCATCVSTVRGALERVPGVSGAEVNLATETALVTFSGGVNPLVRAVHAAGYRAGAAEASLGVQGPLDAAGARSLEAALRSADGVVDAVANAAADEASVRFVRGGVALEALRQAAEAAGFTVTALRESGGEDVDRLSRTDEVRRLRGRLAVSAAAAVAIMALMLPYWKWSKRWARWGQPHQVGAGHAGAVLGGAAVLRRSVERAQAPLVRYEHPDRVGDERRLRLQRLRDRLRRDV